MSDTTGIERLMNPTKLLGALGAGLLSLIVSAPHALHVTAGVAFWFFVLDYVTGTASAALSRDPGTGERLISSHAMRTKFRDKLFCYAQILGLGLGIAALASSWLWLVAAWGAVAAAEGFSIIENLKKSATAPEMAPVRALADKFSDFLRSAGAPDKTQGGNDNAN